MTMTKKEQELRVLLEKAGATMCAVDPNGKKCLISLDFETLDYLVAFIPDSDVGFWLGYPVNHLPDMRSWEVQRLKPEQLGEDWHVVRPYNPKLTKEAEEQLHLQE